LCTNASQAMKKTGGLLAISLEEVFLEEQAERPDLLPGFYVNLRVTDNGEGISSQVAEHIFEPFFTTKEKGQGTGMGLAVVHGIVKSHGGDIQVKSTPGEGSCFDVYLPVIKRDPEPAGVFVVESAPGGKEHILVVDDEIMLLDVAKTRLNSLGYQVTIEMDSHEALKRFAQSPDTYDLVITDMSMPKMAGDKMAKKMMAIRPDIPVIICTGFHEEISEETFVQKGFKRFLMKPIDFNDLALEIRMVLDSPA